MGFPQSSQTPLTLTLSRYIYIPLGGTKNVAVTTVLIFSFVALWHDLSFRLLAWGWLVSLFILPELSARYIFPASKVRKLFHLHRNFKRRYFVLTSFSQYGEKAWYRHLCAAGAVVNMFMMMTANLVGFVIGTDGVSYLVTRLFGTWEGQLTTFPTIRTRLLTLVLLRRSLSPARMCLLIHGCPSHV